MFLGCAPCLTLVVVAEIGYSTHGFSVCVRCWFCLVGLFCFLLLFDSAWWNRAFGRSYNGFLWAVTGTAVMARSANEKKKNCNESMVKARSKERLPGEIMTVGKKSMTPPEKAGPTRTLPFAQI